MKNKSNSIWLLQPADDFLWINQQAAASVDLSTRMAPLLAHGPISLLHTPLEGSLVFKEHAKATRGELSKLWTSVWPL